MDESQEPGLGLDAPPPSRGSRRGRAEPYRVLARKYRPQDFTGLIGQEALVRTLAQCLRRGPHRACLHAHRRARRGQDHHRAHHRPRAQLHRARRQAHRRRPSIPAACASPASRLPSRAMSTCRRWTRPRAPASTTSARSSKACATRRPSARYKVYIIDEVHMLSKQAFNGLLKTLEEPPPHVKFIFATTEIRKVPVTVLSRCQRFDLRRIETEVLVAHLAGIAAKEKIAIEPMALVARSRARPKARCATRCRCSIRRSPITRARARPRSPASRCARCWAWPIAGACSICSRS